jgi:murein L,D-transpeptidase YcbB/YkuD
LSHGCVRVEDPLRLAEYVLGDQPQWTTKKIAAAMQSGREQGVRLKTMLPVHIGYWTAWVQPDGAVTFTDDPYKFDQIQIQRFHQTRETSTW